MLQVKEICSQKGITLQQLAKSLGITYQSLYENLNGNPSLKRLQEIATALDVEIADLFRNSSDSIRCPKCGAIIELNPKEKQ